MCSLSSGLISRSMVPGSTVEMMMTRVSFLLEAASLASEAASNKKDTRVIIISTVLPGTIDREIRPLLNEHIKLCYNPFFIAMGTTIWDFTHPEFVLFGVDDPETADL